MERDAALSPAPSPAAAGGDLSGTEVLEWIEGRAYRSLFRHASWRTRRALGLRTFEAGPLFGGFAPRLDFPAFNRVLGLGRPPDSLWIPEAALEMARRAAAPRAFLPVGPGRVGRRVEALLADQGLPVHNHWMRLSLRLDSPVAPGPVPVPVPGPTPAFEIRTVGGSSARDVGALAASAFRAPPGLAPLIGNAVGAPGWTWFGAWWRGRLAGAGGLYREGTAAWLGYGVVREEFRGRGIHAALIGARVGWARAAGCLLATIETADMSGDLPAPAMRNLLRSGFEPRYRRPNYLVRA